MADPISIVALLDRPNPESFGMVPFVARHADGTLRIHGLQGRDREVLAGEELERLKSDGHALPADGVCDDPEGVLLAGWIGEKFYAQAREAQAPQATPLPGVQVHDSQGGGKFWVAPASEVYGHLHKWLKNAAVEVFETKSRAIADLMVWVLPGDELTWAALWFTRKAGEEQEREVRWWARIERDAGRPVAPGELEQRFNRIVDHYRNDRGQMVESKMRAVGRSTTLRNPAWTPFLWPIAA